MRERLKQILANVLGLPVGTIPDDAAPTNLPEWDSLRHLLVILAVEEAFGRQFPESQLGELTSLPLLLAALETLP